MVSPVMEDQPWNDSPCSAPCSAGWIGLGSATPESSVAWAGTRAQGPLCCRNTTWSWRLTYASTWRTSWRCERTVWQRGEDGMYTGAWHQFARCPIPAPLVLETSAVCVCAHPGGWVTLWCCVYWQWEQVPGQGSGGEQEVVSEPHSSQVCGEQEAESCPCPKHRCPTCCRAPDTWECVTTDAEVWSRATLKLRPAEGVWVPHQNQQELQEAPGEGWDGHRRGQGCGSGHRRWRCEDVRLGTIGRGVGLGAGHRRMSVLLLQ